DLKCDIAGDALLGCALAGDGDRRLVIIQTHKSRLGEGLRHQNCRCAVPAADIGDQCAALETLDDAVESRQPRAYEMRAIAGAEEALGAAEKAMIMRVPT